MQSFIWAKSKSIIWQRKFAVRFTEAGEDRYDFNKDNVITEQTELDSFLKNIFQLETKIGFIDSNNREMEL